MLSVKSNSPPTASLPMDGHAAASLPPEPEGFKEGMAGQSIITQIGSNDVLVGRGAPSNANEGNKRFRELVKQRKIQYATTKKRQMKDQIAKLIVETITSRNGRFLRKLESNAEAEQLGITDTTEVWLLVPTEHAIRKTKQALRDKDVIMPAAGEAESDTSDGGSARRERLTRVAERRYESTSGPSDLLRRQQSAALGSVAVQNFSRGISNGTSQRPSSSLSPAEAAILARYEGSAAQPAMDGNIASLLLAQNGMPQLQPGFDMNLGSLTSNDALLNALRASNPTNDILSAMALRQAMMPMDQQHMPLDGGVYQRLLALNSMPSSNIAQLLSSQAPSVPHVSSHTASQPKADVRRTRAEDAIRLAFLKQKESPQLAVSTHELDLLRVMICHGLPVWSSDANLQSETLNPHADESSFAWSDFVSYYISLADEESEGRQVPILDPLDAAKHLVMLVEKLIAASLSEVALNANEQNKKSNVLLWFRAELARWAAHLGIMDDSRQRPIAFSAQDLGGAIAAGDKVSGVSSQLVGDLTKEDCKVIISQAALVTRLRSVDARNPDALDDKVEKVHHMISSARSTTRISSSVDMDIILLEGILETGYSASLLDQIIPNVSKAAAESHVENLIGSLHVMQANEDLDKVLATQKEGYVRDSVGDNSSSQFSKKRKIDG
ncbi:hypothetical protein MPSEU_000978900 [Mayamaea pseudoterrestris]|nr:hypothetical protein MPSEU_000978900 [Mayamaea pseudoterrestris]